MTDFCWHFGQKSSQTVEHRLGIRRFRICPYLQKFLLGFFWRARNVSLRGLDGWHVSDDGRVMSTERFDEDIRLALFEQTQLGGGGIREIYDSVIHKRTAIIDLDDQ